ncbi:hypothetical protein ES703_117686 [subsurface metagenome]
MGSPNNRTGNKLRKERYIESKISKTSYWFYLTLVYIQRITHGLEGEKGYAHRRQYLSQIEMSIKQGIRPFGSMCNHFELGSKDCIECFGQKIVILKKSQYTKIQANT